MNLFGTSILIDVSDLPTLPAPPPPYVKDGSGWLLALLPALGSVGAITMLATTSGASGRIWLTGALLVVPSLGFALVQLDHQRRRRASGTDPVSAYRRRLAGTRVELVAAIAARDQRTRREHPAPGELALMARTRQGWRGPDHPDFLRVRCAAAYAPLPLSLPDLANADPTAARMLRRLVGVRAQALMATTIDLTCTPRVDVGGDDPDGTIRALLCQAALTHAPAHLAVAILTTEDRRPEWEWVKWLPHAGSDAPDLLGPRRLVVTDTADLPDDERHLLLVADGPEPPTREHTTVLRAGAGEAYDDRLGLAEAEAVARRLCTAAPHATEPADAFALAARGRLRVPIGLDDACRPIDLDLRESSRGGVGPHGLVIGATGSGKSELLRTLVVGLARTHTTDELHLALVDFKGGAAFADLSALPHVTASVTNLAADPTLIDRLHDALSGELTRRQRLLGDAGAASIHDHDGLPSLLVVIDEFSELLEARPAMLELLLRIGRLGRSLGVHLLLASQRLEEGRLRGLDAHLSYRIGLRTFSEAESRAVLRSPEAYALPPVPGAAYLSDGVGGLRRFRAFHVSAGIRAPAPEITRPAAYTSRSVPYDPTAGPSLAEQTITELAALRPARRLWLPPLAGPIAQQGLPQPDGRLAIGVVDRPREQRHDLLTLDLAGATGHLAIVGAPRTGRSTLLQTISCAIARGRTPQEAQLYLIDPAGGLAGTADLPHVSARARDAEVVTRLAARLGALLEGRERGQSDDHGEVYVVVDDWTAFREGHPDAADLLGLVAARGLAQRIHLIVSATRWHELRQRDLFGTRLELRLGDPGDSEIDRRRAAGVPAEPGHGLTTTGHRFLAALPDPGLARSGGRAPQLRLLPDLVRLDTVTGEGITPGLDEASLERVTLPEHLLVYGDTGSGRTALLRAVAREVVRTASPSQAQVVLVDPRLGLLGEVPQGHLLGHLSLTAEAATGLTALAARLEERLPGPSITQAQRRARDWWSGPETWVLVDDHDLAAEALRPLAPLLPRARDIGLHVVLTRRATGAARTLLDPTVQAMRESGASTLLLDGPPEEGPLAGGVRPRRQRPGRGVLVGRDGAETIQVAWAEPA